jgi:hypothetical protein
MLFFRLSSLELALILFGAVLGTTPWGSSWGAACARTSIACASRSALFRRRLPVSSGSSSFGLTLAVGRYDARRAAVVDEANAIGTTYLRAQTLREPIRTRSLEDLVRYTDSIILLSESIPGSAAARDAIVDGERLQRSLWRLAGEALAVSPTASAPRLYVETLNEMIDMQTVHVSALNNRVPNAVLVVEVVGAAVALGLLALYLTILGRGMVTVVLAAGFVSMLLLITFDLDRPVRGLVRVPDTPLVGLRAAMELPPAAQAPDKP